MTPAPTQSTSHKSLERSLGGLAFGIARETSQRDDRRRLHALTERELQFQVPIRGVAADVVVWDEIDLRFRVEFVNATGQRDSPYIEPTMTFGSVIESGGPVIVTAAVVKWNKDEREGVRGAKVAVGVCNPGIEQRFTGKLHLVFQGYGAPDATELEDE